MTVRVAPEWLALREPADAAARSTELLEPLRAWLPSGPLVIHDLGAGSGANTRWLAPRLPGPQRWVLYDNDADLLALAAAGDARTADGSQVAVETCLSDLTRLRPDDLAGTSLVTASALLDLLTADEVESLVDAIVPAGCPALFTLSVVGRVEPHPADSWDAEITAAFNDHQRRVVPGRGRLLGPDAVSATARAFRRRGWTTMVRPSPWRLDSGRPSLLTRWLTEWCEAAVVRRPGLATPVEAYLARRGRACEAGELRVAVHHADLLVLPGEHGVVVGEGSGQARQ
ncbi:SAM-dependent methyltransferase [Haloechinothrix salitolerans]|uniref:SAM-dependent methyltransferase n=1 Tax=Haloechinothrix salitolerans TaxID=926830 RepID=A0ABW2BWY8_9PSEU